MKEELRRKVLVYLLYNATDIRPNAKHITENVRSLYLSNECIKGILFNYFSDGSDKMDYSHEWCCNNHLKLNK